MKAASIEFEHVSKVYGEVAAVHDISFSIAPGTLVTLLGPSGCGKTTTLRMIAGLELPSRGTIRIGGADVTRIPASERDVSMVFQSYALFPHMTVQENVSYGLTVSRLPKPQVLERTRAALATVGLTGFDATLPSEPSGTLTPRSASSLWGRSSSRCRIEVCRLAMSTSRSDRSRSRLATTARDFPARCAKRRISAASWSTRSTRCLARSSSSTWRST